MTSKKTTGVDFAAVSATLRDARDRMVALDRKLDSLIEERERIALAPVAKKEAIAAAEAQIDRARKSGELALQDAVAPVARGQDMDLRQLLVRQVIGDPTSARPRDDVLLTLLTEPLKKSIRAAIERSPAFADDALPAAERARKVAELDETISEVESERKGLADELRAAGLDVKDELEVVDG